MTRFDNTVHPRYLVSLAISYANTRAKGLLFQRSTPTDTSQSEHTLPKDYENVPSIHLVCMSRQAENTVLKEAAPHTINAEPQSKQLLVLRLKGEVSYPVDQTSCAMPQPLSI